MRIELDVAEAGVGAEPGLVILVWRKTPGLATVRQTIDAVMGHFASTTGKSMMLVVVKPEVGAMNSEVRKIVEKALNDSHNKMGGVAIAVTATGFGAAAMRAALTGFYLVSKPPYEVKVHADLASAAAWIESNWSAGSPKLPANKIAQSAQLIAGT